MVITRRPYRWHFRVRTGRDTRTGTGSGRVHKQARANAGAEERPLGSHVFLDRLAISYVPSGYQNARSVAGLHLRSFECRSHEPRDQATAPPAQPLMKRVRHRYRNEIASAAPRQAVPITIHVT